jgi:hypothetical protein
MRITISTFVDWTTYRRLVKAANDQGVKKSVTLREALEYWLDDRQVPEPLESELANEPLMREAGSALKWQKHEIGLPLWRLAHGMDALTDEELYAPFEGWVDPNTTEDALTALLADGSAVDEPPPKLGPPAEES